MDLCTLHPKIWNFPGILCIMHLGYILCTLYQNATLVAEKAHEQTPQKPNGGNVVWSEEKGTATKVLHEQKIDPNQVYIIQHVNLTDSPKNAIKSHEISHDVLDILKSPKDFSQTSLGIFLKYSWKSFKFLGCFADINLTDSPEMFWIPRKISMYSRSYKSEGIFSNIHETPFLSTGPQTPQCSGKFCP